MGRNVHSLPLYSDWYSTRSSLGHSIYIRPPPPRSLPYWGVLNCVRLWHFEQQGSHCISWILWYIATKNFSLFKRRWVLLDENDAFVSQRKDPKLVLVVPHFEDGKYLCLNAPGMETLKVDLELKVDKKEYKRIRWVLHLPIGTGNNYIDIIRT